jgi:hypothetical protein
MFSKSLSALRIHAWTAGGRSLTEQIHVAIGLVIAPGSAAEQNDSPQREMPNDALDDFP